MKHPLRRAWLLPGLMAFLLFFTASCERRQAENLQERNINIHTAGELKKIELKNGFDTIYLDVRDETGQMPVTPVILKSLLEADNFQVVDAPSKAAYILHISILQEGSTSPANIEELVMNGYGNKAAFTGGDSSGWLADALLVKRRVPQEKRQSHERLKNISSRNAIENSQMRIGLETDGSLRNRAEHLAVFGRPLASALHAALTGKSDHGFNME